MRNRKVWPFTQDAISINLLIIQDIMSSSGALCLQAPAQAGAMLMYVLEFTSTLVLLSRHCFAYIRHARRGGRGGGNWIGGRLLVVIGDLYICISSSGRGEFRSTSDLGQNMDAYLAIKLLAGLVP